LRPPISLLHRLRSEPNGTVLNLHAVFLVQRMRMRMLSEDEMLPIVQTLLAAGVDPTARTPSGQTALDLARDHGYSAIAALLKAA
jgi:hypothetical protein